MLEISQTFVYQGDMMRVHFFGRRSSKLYTLMPIRLNEPTTMQWCLKLYPKPRWMNEPKGNKYNEVFVFKTIP
ncbi:hypothetical protein CARUB_v10006169mg [Capsella rubella]|uniref:Uncharacterized protein n=1 Tax=Capsella rubella TaxID=81985 RepID=R0F251_9BRAS|nr:hypothetical protein CARUB_v10006169mg [Capsella rubella]